MAWVTWRQHRHQLLIGLALIVFLALAALVTGLPMRTAYQREALSSCLPPTARSGCDIIVRHFQSEFGSRVDIARYLILLPALVGMFVGAPLLARELEHGTHRFAWTQSVTRRRWLLSKTLLLALAVTLSAVVLSAIVTWWRQPFDGLEGRMSPSGFEIQGLVVPAYAAVRSHSRRARRRRASAQPGGDVADAWLRSSPSGLQWRRSSGRATRRRSTKRWPGSSRAPTRATGC